jgi:hypothetical protein
VLGLEFAAADEPEPVVVLVLPVAAVDELLAAVELALDGAEVPVGDAAVEPQEGVVAGEVGLDVVPGDDGAVVALELELLVAVALPAVVGFALELAGAVQVPLAEVPDVVGVVLVALDDPDFACVFAPAPSVAVLGLAEFASRLTGRVAAACPGGVTLADDGCATLSRVVAGPPALAWS